MKEGGRKQSGGVMSPCAACKLLRRRCSQDCIFAPYFPADQPHKFASVHKVFGASNVNKMLQELGEEQRSDAVSSMVYEANARVRDPVYGCVGAISSLQKQVDVLQTELAFAQAEVVQMRMSTQSSSSTSLDPATENINNGIGIGNGTPSGSSRLLHSSLQTRSCFYMDMVVDQTNMDDFFCS